MLQQHIIDIRKDPRYQGAVIYVYIEANLNYIGANRIKNLLSLPAFYPLRVQHFDPSTEQKAGVYTGEVQKEQYIEETKRALSEGALCYAENFISNDPDIKTEISQQLEAYRADVKTDPLTHKRTVYHTGKSAGKKDDCALVVQMMLYWSRLFRDSHEYAEAAESNGWRL
jgi:hypothetical protein